MQQLSPQFICAPDIEVWVERRRISYNRPVNINHVRCVYPDDTQDKFNSDVTYYGVVFDGTGQRWLFLTEEERDDILDRIMAKYEIEL